MLDAAPVLDHTIVRVTDAPAAARFLADVLGPEVGRPNGPFLPVRTGNGVTLDYMTVDPSGTGNQHLAFGVTEQQFDRILERLVARGLTYYADPFAAQPGQLNHEHGGRGLYSHDPDGNNLEIQTVPDGVVADGAGQQARSTYQ